MATMPMALSFNPLTASRTASLASRWITDVPPLAFGSMIASGLPGMTASRSSSVSPVSSPFTRTRRRGRFAAPWACCRKASALARASALRSVEIESSRSTISASAPLAIALSSFLGESAGTNRRERMDFSFVIPGNGKKRGRPGIQTEASCLISGFRVHAFGAPRNDLPLCRPLAHEGLPPAFGNELAVLIVGAVMKLDDARGRSRIGFAFVQDLGGAMHGIILEQRMGKFRLGHAEIGDRGADGEIIDGNADHQPEREQ